MYMCVCVCVRVFVCVTSLSCNSLLTAITVDFTNNSTVIAEDGGVVAVNVTVSGGISDLPITLSLTTMSRTATNGECKTDIRQAESFALTSSGISHCSATYLGH